MVDAEGINVGRVFTDFIGRGIGGSSDASVKLTWRSWAGAICRTADGAGDAGGAAVGVEVFGFLDLRMISFWS